MKDQILISIHQNINNDLLKKLPFNKGCYELLWYENDKPKPLHRLKKIDPNGTIYIGKSDNLVDRVNSLRKSVLANTDGSQSIPIEKGHNAFSRKFYRIRKLIDPNDLKIRIISLNIDCSILESLLLEVYAFNFGELPPLNGSYGKYYFNENELLKLIRELKIIV